MAARNNNKIQVKEVFEIAEIAHQLGISQKIIRRDIASGKLDSAKIGNKYQITFNAFNQYKKQLNTNNATELHKKNAAKKISDVEVEWTDIFSNWNKPKKSHLTFVDLFSGAGGITKGFELAGLKGICGLDCFVTAL